MAAAAPDVPLLITSDSSSSERRINPSWSIAHLKGRLEPITGIPAGCQKLQLKIASQTQAIEAADEQTAQLQQWPLQAYAEIHVLDTRPPGLRANYTDTSSVSKYEMPQSTYESRTDSVLHYKKLHQLGRFDPSLPDTVQQKLDAGFREAKERGIESGRRCQLLPEGSDGRRGVVRFVGPVEELPGDGVVWVGVELDEPVGRNDGTVKGRRVFECKGEKYGAFVRVENVEVGEFPVRDEFGDEDEEF